MDGVMTALKIALRVLAKSRAYTAVAVLTLALAIGATTAIFSVVHGVLLAPLPYRDAERLVAIWETHPSFERMAVAYPNYLDWAKSQRSFESIGAHRPVSFTVTGGERAERLQGQRFSASFMPTLGVAPALGRGFTPEEDQPNGARVALISDGLWERRFGRDRSAIGATLTLDGRPHTVIGVLPPRFAFAPKAEIVAPISQIGPQIESRGSHWIPMAVARLRPGVTLDQARADMESVGAAIGAVHSNAREVRPRLAYLRDDLVKDVRATLWVLMGAVGFVLLVAIANVAGLSLARGASRRKEMAVRAALGAGKRRLIAQVLIESSLVSLVGGALGVVLALWGVDVLSSMRPEALPNEAVITVDLRVLAFTLGISVAAGLLFGVLPALQAARSTDLAGTLKDADLRTTGGLGRSRARSALIVAEVAMALVLLVGAGLSIRAFVGLSRLDLGFRSEGNAVLSVFLTSEHTREPDGQRAFIARLSDQIRAVPGVASATLTTGIPVAGGSETSFEIEGAPKGRPDEMPMAVYYVTDEHFDDVFGLRLLSGRFLSKEDVKGRAPVVVVDENVARTYFPKGDAVGKRISVGGDVKLEIVGVVAHVRHYGPGEPEPAVNQLYMSIPQVPDDVIGVYVDALFVTMSAAPGVAPASLTHPVATAIAGVDPDLAVYRPRTLETIVDESLAARRFAMMLLGVFAAVALVLAVVGLYSVLSYLVAQRRHEIGVRIALGARPGSVERLVIRQGLTLAGLGLLIGAGASVALREVLGSIVVGVEPTDPITLAAVAATLGAAALLASWLPARRAARVDPMIALRSE
jgi:putative ABC transport system permease protein